MKTALSVEGNRISPTLGGTAEFILLSDEGQMRLVPAEKIPLFLQKQKVGILICNGIGNCMKELLTAMGIEVIPGVSGDADDVIDRYRSGTLVPGDKYSCADFGRSCGECPGSF